MDVETLRVYFAATFNPAKQEPQKEETSLLSEALHD